MNLADLREHARIIAEQQKVVIKGVKMLQLKADRLRADFTRSLQAIVDNPDGDVQLDPYIEQIDTLETETSVAVQKARASINRANSKIEDVRMSTVQPTDTDISYDGIMSNLEKVNRLDPTSRQLLADYETEYAATYYTLIIKVILMVILLALMRHDWKGILGAYVVIYIIVYIGEVFYLAFTTTSGGQVV